MSSIKFDPRVLILVIFTVIIFAAACYASFNLLSKRSANDQPVAEQPAAGQEAVVNINQRTMAIDNTTVTTLYLPEKEVRTLAERPVQTEVVVVEAAPTVVPAATEIPVVQDIVPTATQVPASLPQNQIVLIDYTVQAGDTLYSIAGSKGSSVELMAEYGIDAQDLIPGAVIRVPVANSQYCANSGYRSHVVQFGDTTYSLGLRFGTTHDVIRQVNGLDANYTIYLGQVLCIP